MNKYMTKKEAAAYIRVSPGTLDNFRKRGQIACSKVGGRVVFDRDALDAFVRDRVEEPKEHTCGTK